MVARRSFLFGLIGAQAAHAYRPVGAALLGGRYAAAPRGGLRAVQRTFRATVSSTFWDAVASFRAPCDPYVR